MSQILVPIVLIISSAGLLFSYLMPGYETLQAFKAQADLVEEAKQDFSKIENKRNELMTTYRSFSQPDLDALKRITPEKVDIVQTILTIDKIAQANNIYVDSFGVPSEEAPRTRQAATSEQVVEYGKAVFQVSLTGSYNSLRQFFYTIEKSQILMDVIELMIEPPDDKEVESGRLHALLSLQSYWLY